MFEIQPIERTLFLLTLFGSSKNYLVAKSHINYIENQPILIIQKRKIINQKSMMLKKSNHAF